MKNARQGKKAAPKVEEVSSERKNKFMRMHFECSRRLELMQERMRRVAWAAAVSAARSEDSEAVKEFLEELYKGKHINALETFRHLAGDLGLNNLAGHYVSRLKTEFLNGDGYGFPEAEALRELRLRQSTIENRKH